jgi:adenosylcobinamide-GDP ribazoletransferase
MVYAATFPLARSDGMAASFGRGLNRSVILAATFFAALASVLAGRVGLAALVAALVVATIIAQFAVRQLGGLTGDIYGTICETVELSVLLVGGLNIWRG